MLRQVRFSIFAFVAGAGLLAPVVLSGQAAAQKPAADSSKLNQLTPEEQKGGWILLFNGRNLDGWRGYKKTDASGTRWKVENGMLTLPPNDGKDTLGARDIISNDTFEQFELTWEWRIAQAGNSGVKYFVLEDRDDAIGHEYQLIDDERHPDAKVGPKRQTAAFYDVLAASDRPLEARRRIQHEPRDRARQHRRALVERQEGADVPARFACAPRRDRRRASSRASSGSASCRTATSSCRITAIRCGSGTSRSRRAREARSHSGVRVRVRSAGT